MFMMNMDFNSIIAIVTGAGGGIGSTFSSKLLEMGSKVFLTDIAINTVQDVYNKLKEKYEGKVKYAQFSCDVTSEDNFKEAFLACERELGKPNLLINNAGAIEETSFRNTVRLILEAQVKGTEIAIEYMGKDKGGQGGNVVNIASTAGLTVTHPFFPYYSSAKAGIIVYTKSIAHPLNIERTGVNIQCLCPGKVDTLFTIPNDCHTIGSNLTDLAKEFFATPAMKRQDVASSLIRLLKDGKPGAILCTTLEKGEWYHEM